MSITDEQDAAEPRSRETAGRFIRPQFPFPRVQGWAGKDAARGWMLLAKGSIMSKLDDSLKALLRARKRLSAEQDRRKRKLARKVFSSAMRSVKIQLNNEYPKIDKPNPITTPVERARKKALPFVRAFNEKRAELFIRLMCAAGRSRHGIIPRIAFRDGGRRMAGRHFGVLYLKAGWSDREKWSEVVSFFGWNWDNIEFYAKFFRELIPVPDLALVAEHSKFLESARRMGKMTDKYSAANLEQS